MSRSLANRILIGWAVLGVAASITLQVLNLLGFLWISDISLAIIRRYPNVSPGARVRETRA
jgi:hypothetical protein